MRQLPSDATPDWVRKAANRINGLIGSVAALEGAETAWGDLTGTLADQTDLQAALDAKAGASHDHDADYAPLSHTHAQSDVTGLTAALDAKAALAGATFTGPIAATNLSGTNTGDQDLSSYATTAAVAAGYQPLDSDLTAIAALATTAYGRGFLDLADAAAARAKVAVGLTGFHGFLPVAAGGYIAFAANAQPFTTGVMTADRLQATPIVPARTVTLDQLAAYVVTGAASSNVRFGIYADSGAGVPGALLADTGNIASATSSTAISGSISVTLQAGVLYWLAAHYSGTPTLRVVQTAGLLIASCPDGSSNSPAGGLNAARAFGALPDPCPALLPQLTTFPFVRGRVA